ncbi:MAG: hypothetical protein Q8M56_09815, partial [Desulfobacterales bacterium]|nr:hypothetical protein [Desulfobacterales bacterium]
MTILTINGAEAMTENEKNLLDLATREFGTITETEGIFLRLVAISSHMDCSKGGDKNPANADKWGQERIIRTSLIKWLCSNTQAASLVGTQGIALIGARLEGSLDLSFTKVPFPLFFVNCSIPEDIYIPNANIRNLKLSNSHLASITAGNMHVEGG